ncbi:MAG: invasion associated locus B family protein [Alphaproteobacteria bacterium]|nr:MAG: invasion associated locus B family protein [Alphaproteobacteria bacterium]
MTRFRHILLTAAALALGAAPLAAQDTTTTEAPAAKPKTETAAETETPREATEVPATPNENDKRYPIAPAEQPREKVKATHDDWQVICSIADEDRCYMYQLAKNAEGQPVAEFTLIRLPAGGQATAGATVVTGLGVLLQRGLGLQIDSSKPLGYPFTYCAQSGCFSRLGLTAATITRLKKGAQAKLTVFGVGVKEPIVGVLSLKGFTAAYEELKPIKQN